MPCPSLVAEVTTAEAGTSWSPIDAVASCLVEHFMGFQDDAAGTWQCPADLAATVAADIHDTTAAHRRDAGLNGLHSYGTQGCDAGPVQMRAVTECVLDDPADAGRGREHRRPATSRRRHWTGSCPVWWSNVPPQVTSCRALDPCDA